MWNVTTYSEQKSELDESVNFIEKSAIVGKNLSFVFKITNCRGLPNKYTDMQCKYKIYLDEKDTLTTKISLTSNPDFNSKGSSINNVIYFSLYFTPSPMHYQGLLRI